MSKSNKIIKKKDLGKLKFKDDIEELVDADGDPIEGSDSSDNNTEVKTAPQQTTDDFVATSRQPNMNYYNAHGMGGGGQYARGGRRGDGYMPGISESEIDEAKKKMEAMIEDIMSKKSAGNDVVKKSNSSDVNAKGIPSIDSIDKAEVIEATKTFVKSLKDLSGKEITIVLNEVLESVDSIPTEYKKILQNKI
jgi:hypothetical protein